jgi:hypothetical protein
MGILRRFLLYTVASLIIVELFLSWRPEPHILTAGLADGDIAITDTLRARYPIGSPAKALEEELKREGYWGSVHVDPIMGTKQRLAHYVRYRRRVGLIETQISTIEWEIDDDDRLTDIRGSKFIDGPFP